MKLITLLNEQFEVIEVIDHFEPKDLNFSTKGNGSIKPLLNDLLGKSNACKLFTDLDQNGQARTSYHNYNFSLYSCKHFSSDYFLFILETNPEKIGGVLKDYLNSIIRHSPGFLYLKNKNLEYILCNENFAKAAGLNSPKEIEGKTDFDLAWGETEAELFRKGDREALQGVHKINFEEPQLQASGETKIVLANKVPVYNEKKNS